MVGIILFSLIGISIVVIFVGLILDKSSREGGPVARKKRVRAKNTATRKDLSEGGLPTMRFIAHLRHIADPVSGSPRWQNYLLILIVGAVLIPITQWAFLGWWATLFLVGAIYLVGFSLVSGFADALHDFHFELMERAQKGTLVDYLCIGLIQLIFGFVGIVAAMAFAIMLSLALVFAPMSRLSWHHTFNTTLQTLRKDPQVADRIGDPFTVSDTAWGQCGFPPASPGSSSTLIFEISGSRGHGLVRVSAWLAHHPQEAYTLKIQLAFDGNETVHVPLTPEKHR